MRWERINRNVKLRPASATLTHRRVEVLLPVSLFPASRGRYQRSSPPTDWPPQSANEGGHFCARGCSKPCDYVLGDPYNAARLQRSRQKLPTCAAARLSERLGDRASSPSNGGLCSSLVALPILTTNVPTATATVLQSRGATAQLRRCDRRTRVWSNVIQETNHK